MDNYPSHHVIIFHTPMTSNTKKCVSFGQPITIPKVREEQIVYPRTPRSLENVAEQRKRTLQSFEKLQNLLNSDRFLPTEINEEDL